MTIHNRRLREVRKEIQMYKNRIEDEKSEYNKQLYFSKIEMLEREENEILKRYNVIV